MNDNWHYGHDGQRFGPVSIEELRQLVASGMLCADDLVWRTGLDEWTPAGQVSGVVQAATVSRRAGGRYRNHPRGIGTRSSFWARLCSWELPVAIIVESYWGRDQQYIGIWHSWKISSYDWQEQDFAFETDGYLRIAGNDQRLCTSKGKDDTNPYAIWRYRADDSKSLANLCLTCEDPRSHLVRTIRGSLRTPFREQNENPTERR